MFQTRKKNFDDKPCDLCTKVFQQVSEKGMTYLFLFCPRHSHCHGFHIVSGNEGRKDPAAAAAAAAAFVFSMTRHLTRANMLKNDFPKNSRVFQGSFTGLLISVLHP